MSNPSVENVGDKTRQSVKWSFSLQILQKLFFFISGIIVARLLTPSDFGLATMALTLDTITWLVSTLGVNSAVVHYQDNIDKRLNAAFWLTLISTSFFVLVQILIAPIAARFYNAPVLDDIIRISAIATVIFAIGSIHKTILIKNIEFKKVSILETSAGLLKNIFYIVFALLGFGVWSFIYPKIVSAIITTVALWKMSDWRPKFEFHFKYWVEMLNFGKNILLSSIIDYLLNNSSYILIGNMVGSTTLGLYTFAYDKSLMIVNNIAYPITMISFPAFSQLQEHKEVLKDAFFKTIKIISIFAFPYSIAQIVLGKEYITLIFGDKWYPSVLIFQILLVYSMFRAVSQLGAPILQGVGKPNILLNWTFIFSPFFIISVFLGAKTSGVLGVAIASSVIGILGSIIFMSIVVKVLQWEFKEIVHAITPAFVSSLLMGIVILLVKILLNYLSFPDYSILILLIPLSIVVYLMSIGIFFDKTYHFLLNNLKKMIPFKANAQSAEIQN